MKISLYVPKNSQCQRGFIKQELAQSQNIKSKTTRKSVSSGLKKILSVLPDSHHEGMAIFTDGIWLSTEKYEGIRKIYYCGGDYYPAPVIEDMNTMIVVMDANEATIGKTNGERIEVIWSEQSLVPRKHNKGGQSKNRFQRGRQEALKGWIKKVIEKIITIRDTEDIIIGGPGMTKDAMIKRMPPWLSDKITDARNVGYTDENGLWETMKIQRYTKG